MVFSSLSFLFLFLPAVLLVYFIVPRQGKNTVLFLFSLLFYAWGEPIYVLLMIFSTVLDYTCGRLVDKFRGTSKRKIGLIISVVVNLGLLCFFKYSDFLIGTINEIFGCGIPLLNLPLPIGISFYTFQTMSYTIDVYRNEAKVQKNIISFGAYVALFPQLIAGPIVRYRDIAEQLDSRTHSTDNFGEGVKRFVIEAHETLPAKQAKKNIAALKALSDSLAAQRITMKVMLVPTASEILSDKLPAFAPNADQHSVIEYAKRQGLDVVDVTEALSEHKDEYIYYKTDHHWTSLGAYYAYAEWVRSKVETPAPLSEWTKRELCNDFRGTTFSKVNYPFAPYDTIDAYFKQESHTVDYNGGDYITDSIYEEKFLDGSDKYAVFFNSNQSTTKISGNGEGKLLIIKDSYANTFGQFVVDDYAETHLIDMRFFKGNVSSCIAENGISEALVLYNIPNFCEDTAAARCAG